jgi:hypothetical protein
VAKIAAKRGYLHIVKAMVQRGGSLTPNMAKSALFFGHNKEAKYILDRCNLTREQINKLKSVARSINNVDILKYLKKYE